MEVRCFEVEIGKAQLIKLPHGWKPFAVESTTDGFVKVWARRKRVDTK